MDIMRFVLAYEKANTPQSIMIMQISAGPVYCSHLYYMPGKVWEEITNPFLNFNGCTVEV